MNARDAENCLENLPEPQTMIILAKAHTSLPRLTLTSYSQARKCALFSYPVTFITDPQSNP